MKVVTRITVFVMFCVSIADSVPAQWSEIAHRIMEPEQQYNGAIRYCDGVVWAGTKSLYYSKDTGVTWTHVTSLPYFDPAFGISDITIYDSLNVLVCIDQWYVNIHDTTTPALFLTTNGGKTWKDIRPKVQAAIFVQSAFNGSAKTFHVLQESSLYSLFTSTDAGTTWQQNIPTTTPNAIALGFGVGSDRSITVFSSLRGTMKGWVNRSSDLGKTWSSDGGLTDGDCNTISIDSCDVNRLYLVNENTAMQSDEQSRLNTSTDGGSTWQTIAIGPLSYFNGSLATTRSEE